jgi:hypothetical protein
MSFWEEMQHTALEQPEALAVDIRAFFRSFRA